MAPLIMMRAHYMIWRTVRIKLIGSINACVYVIRWRSSLKRLHSRWQQDFAKLNKCRLWKSYALRRLAWTDGAT